MMEPWAVSREETTRAKKMILLSTKASDAHSSIISEALTNLDVENKILHLGGLASQPDHFKINAVEQTEFFLKGQRINPKLVWFRKLSQALNIPDKENLSEYENANVDETFLRFARGLQLFLGQMQNTINAPQVSITASDKIYQSTVARKVGFHFPKTVFATKPDAATLNQLSDKNGQIIYKPLRPSIWRMNEDKHSYSMAQTALIASEAILESKSEDLIPAIFQQPISKKSEIRVCVFGKHIIAIEQRPDSQTPNAVDWRVSNSPEGFSFEEVALPSELIHKIQKFMKLTKLQVGAIDFAVDQKGDPYFLEINPFGQFLYMEQFNPDIQILKTVIKFILEKAGYGQTITIPTALSVTDYPDALSSANRDFRGTGAHFFDQVSRKSLSL